ncbi:MAG: hypothetical protein R3Y07_07685, partial [Eubacteriales bacterium]
MYVAKKSAVLLSFLILLGGCAQQTDQKSKALEVRTTLLEVDRYTAQCDMVADYGARVYQFSVLATLEGEETSIVVTQPENLSGISVTQRGIGQNTELIWEDTILETGDLTTTGITPLTAIPAIFATAKSGYIAGVNQKLVGETEILELYCRDPDGEVGEGVEYLIWLAP